MFHSEDDTQFGSTRTELLPPPVPAQRSEQHLFAGEDWFLENTVPLPAYRPERLV